MSTGCTLFERMVDLISVLNDDILAVCAVVCWTLSGKEVFLRGSRGW